LRSTPSPLASPTLASPTLASPTLASPTLAASLALLLASCTPSAGPAAGGDGGGLDSGTDGGGTDGGGSDGGGGGGGDTGTGRVQARYDLADPSFLAAPWPSDRLLDADGHPDLSHFPNPLALPLVDTYLSTLEQTRGYGTNGPLYLCFDGPIDISLLPDEAGSVATDASLQLLDVDPASPGYGERVPLQWSWSEAETTWLPVDTLSVAPVFGFPLRPATTYALVLGTAIADPAPAFPAALDSDPLLAPLRSRLALDGLDPASLAVATVFTTTDPLQALGDANRWIRERDPSPDLSQLLSPVRTGASYEVSAGTYRSPVFQEGTRPYLSKGGGLVFDLDSEAEPVSWDQMRLSVAMPLDRSHPPAAGWPVVIYLHGTGGDYLTCCNGNGSGEPAVALGAQGLLVLGIDLPLHGTRTESDAVLSDLVFPYNLLNPDSARSVERQIAIDALYLAHALATHPPTFTLADGSTLSVDPAHILLMGHSQGGIGLALALPFLGGDGQAAVLSGTGGDTALTLLDRTDPIDIALVLSGILGLGPDETLDALHPASGMVQWLAEVTDPVNAGPYYFDRGGLWAGQRPLSVLLFSGILDPEVSYRNAEALTAAARLPVLAPAATAPVSWSLAGIGEQAGPLQDDAAAFDGSTVTAALSQWPDDGHGAAFDNPAAWALYSAFLGSAGQGAPVIGD